MRRDGWNLRSALWCVFLVALSLKVAISTWDNLKKDSIEYHRALASGCERQASLHQMMANLLENEARSQPGGDQAVAEEERQSAIWYKHSARSFSLQAASLTEKAELCEQSLLGWIYLEYDTSRNPPDLPVHHSTGNDHRVWSRDSVLGAFFGHPIIGVLARMDFFGLACLAVVIVGKKWHAQARSAGSRLLRLARKIPQKKTC
jgi:hypothetical protein